MENKHLNNNELRPRKWLLYVLIVISIIIAIILSTKAVSDRKNNVDDDFSIIDKFFDKFFDTVVDKGKEIYGDNNFNDDDKDNDPKDDSAVDFLDEITKKAFNLQFEMYVGTNTGSQVSSFIDVITTNNKTNPNHMLTVVFENVNTTDADEIRNIKKSLDKLNEYEVILDYDENGFVYLITIEK